VSVSTDAHGDSHVGTENHVDFDCISVWFESDMGRTHTLDEISFSIRRNEFVCIMGRSGCGKTTLLNILGGFVKPTSGQAKISGREITGPGADRCVVFQSDAVFPWMTVEENIGFSLAARGLPKSAIDEAVTRYVDLVHLTDFRKAWPRQLSDGMKKRVDVARGYAADPEVLLLDEPFGMLDVLTKERLQAELLHLSLISPRTCVFVTHDVEEALFLGDRVVLMSPRPGTVAGIWEPKLPKPRDISIKLDPRFIELRAEITEALQKENNA
jgi:NitT/TauT family transport system ATP-binding protein